MIAGRRTNDSAHVGRLRRRFSSLAVPLVVLVLGWTGACGTNDAVPGVGPSVGEDSGTPAPPGTGCGVGETGCACTKEGAVASCGRVDSRDGNYVTCSLGYSACTGGTWGPCVGNHLVTRSLPNVVLTAGGIHFLSPTYPPCANVCDPNGCMSTLDTPADVDAAGIQQGPDGGIILQDATVPIDAGCFGLACHIANCGNTALTTTLSGVVYDPAGNNPLYNAYVYIPAIPGAALPTFTTGATCDTCGGAGALNAIQATQTDAAGNFTLTNVPTVNNLAVVVQLGKWRREIVLKTITSCTSNTVTGNCNTPNPADCVFRLPRNQTDGYDPVAGTYTKADLPHVAIVQRRFRSVRLPAAQGGHRSASEFGDYTSNKRFHFYEADGDGGGDTLDPAYGMNDPGSTLWNNNNGAAPLASYDVILLPCEGAAYDQQGTSANTPYQNVITYSDAGGRVFMTHFGYSWLQFPAGKHYVPATDNWSILANWSPTGTAETGTIDTQDPMTGEREHRLPQGRVYSAVAAEPGRHERALAAHDPRGSPGSHDAGHGRAELDDGHRQGVRDRAQLYEPLHVQHAPARRAHGAMRARRLQRLPRVRERARGHHQPVHRQRGLRRHGDVHGVEDGRDRAVQRGVRDERGLPERLVHVHRRDRPALAARPPARAAPPAARAALA